ncbi:MAG: DUF4124 domain-containing protein [Pseudomonadales bacterium]
MKRYIYSLLALVWTATAAADEIYRWVDAAGVVNYTQQKPRDTQSQKVTTNQGATRIVEEAAPAVSPEPPADGSAALSESQQTMLENLQAAERARQEEIAKIRSDNCEKSRALLDRLTVNARVRVTEPSGQQRIMGEDERQERISEAQVGIAQNCDSA